jgi:murein DD-endopeptidase MepM/ murein hydrolase activator NlpD
MISLHTQRLFAVILSSLLLCSLQVAALQALAVNESSTKASQRIQKEIRRGVFKDDSTELNEKWSTYLMLLAQDITGQTQNRLEYLESLLADFESLERELLLYDLTLSESTQFAHDRLSDLLLEEIAKEMLTSTRLQSTQSGAKVRFLWPTTMHKLTSAFGPRFDPIDGKQRFHHGIDIAASYGAAVNASASGHVLFAGYTRGYGHHIILEHKSGFRTLYAHLSQIKVQKKQKVIQNQIIGTVGSSGKSTGPHLHFSIQKHERYLNPLSVLRP